MSDAFFEHCIWLVFTDTRKACGAYVVIEHSWSNYQSARRHMPEGSMLMWPEIVWTLPSLSINHSFGAVVTLRTNQLALGHRVSAPSSVYTVSFSKLLNNFHWELYSLYRRSFVERIWHCVLTTMEGRTCSFRWGTNIAVLCVVFMVGGQVGGFCEGGNEVSVCIK